MIRRTLKKKPSLVKNKTGKRKNTKGIKRNRRKVHKTRKRKGGVSTPLTNIVHPVAELFYTGLYNAGQAARYIKEKLEKMPRKGREKFQKIQKYIEKQNKKGKNTYKGGEKEENIEGLIENIEDGDDGVSRCKNIEVLTLLFTLAENEVTKTALKNKINELEEIKQLKNEGNCENITTEAEAEPSAEGEEPSAGSAIEEAEAEAE